LEDRFQLLLVNAQHLKAVPGRKPDAKDGEWMVTGLSFPTAMTFGRDGDLFISNKGFGQPTNTAGEIVKVTLVAPQEATERHP
jgi:hypothetical protein